VDALTFVGHSTVLVDLDGTRLITDPLLRPRVTHLRRRAPLRPGELGPIDAVLVSHAHYDHLDRRSLALLGLATPVVVPRGFGRILRRRGHTAVIEADVGERIELGALSVLATDAEHDGGRLPVGAQGSALGYVLEGSRRIYFAGDTDVFDGMTELGEIDVALIPIWGWGPSLGPGHMDPEAAARAVALVRPRLVVPIHWGTYHPLFTGVRTPPSYLAEPPDRFAAATAREAPGVEVRILQPGETLEL
jgi:L-ascorbate metabolism protein UlaG (beta-lactamase superfamily)